MTQPRRQILAVLALGSLSAFIVVAFLLPKGESIAYSALCAALLFCTIAAVSYVYSLWEPAAEPLRDEALRSQVDVYVLEASQRAVPAALLEGAAPLVSVVRDGEVLHPEFADRLAPYFADPALAFVQTATHYQGEGRVAEAFISHEALRDSVAEGKNALNASTLRGSGLMLSREALRAAYYAGINFEELGLRLQALGYASHFETTPLVLAYAPQTLAQYWPVMLERGMRALALLFPAAAVRGLSFAARLQYLSSAAAYAAIVAGATAVVCAPLAFLVRGTGPLIFSSVALPGLVFMAAALALAALALVKISKTNVLAASALALAGTYAAFYTAARIGAVYTRAGYRRALVIVRGGGSAGTAPAGSPARL